MSSMQKPTCLETHTPTLTLSKTQPFLASIFLTLPSSQMVDNWSWAIAPLLYLLITSDEGTNRPVIANLLNFYTVPYPYWVSVLFWFVYWGGGWWCVCLCFSVAYKWTDFFVAFSYCFVLVYSFLHSSPDLPVLSPSFYAGSIPTTPFSTCMPHSS